MATAYTLLASDYTPTLHEGDPAFEGVFYWDDVEYTVNENAFTSFTEALYAGERIYGFSGSYTANNVVNNYGANLTSDILTIGWNAANDRFEATATPGGATTLAIKTKLTNTDGKDFTVGSGVSIYGNVADTAATIANAGTFHVSGGAVVNAKFTGEGTIELAGTIDAGNAIKGDNTIIVNSSAVELRGNASIEGSSLTVNKNLDLYDTASLNVNSLTKNARVYAFGTNKIKIGEGGVTGSAIISVRDDATLTDSSIGSTVYFAKNTAISGESNIKVISIKGTNTDPQTAGYRNLSITGTLTTEKIDTGTSAGENSAFITIKEATVSVSNEDGTGTFAITGKSEITVQNSTLTADVVNLSGTMIVSGASTLNLGEVKPNTKYGPSIINLKSDTVLTSSTVGGGKLNIEGGSSVTFAGANSAGTITNAGTITITKSGDGVGSLSATSVNGNIVIASDVLAGGTKNTYEIVSGAANATVTEYVEGYDLVKFAGSAYLASQFTDASTLYVSSDYTGAIGDVAEDGNIIGFNAFGSLADITINNASAEPVYHNDSTAIVFAKDHSEFTDLAKKVYYYANNAGVELKGNETGTELILSGNVPPRFYLMGNSVKYASVEAYKDGIADLTAQKFTIDSSLTVSGAAFLYAGQALDVDEVGTRYASKANLTINGTVNAGLYVAPYSTVTVSKTGKVLSNETDLSGSGNISLTIRPGSEVTVNGENNALQLKEFLLKYIDGGTVVLNDTKACFNAIEVDGPNEGRALAATTGVLTLNNTTIDIQKFGTASYLSDKVFNKTEWVDTDLDKVLTVTLNDNSVLNVGEGKTFNVLDKITVDVLSGSEINANAVTNSGTINVGNAAVADDPDTTDVDEAVVASNGTLTATSITNSGTISAYAGSEISVTGSIMNTNGGSITLDNSKLTADTITNNYTGANTISILNGSEVHVTGTGAGKYFQTYGALTITDSTVTVDSAFGIRANGNTTTITNSTINASITVGQAGSSATSVIATNSTIVANEIETVNNEKMKSFTMNGGSLTTYNLKAGQSFYVGGNTTLTVTNAFTGVIELLDGATLSNSSIAAGTGELNIGTHLVDEVATDNAVTFSGANSFAGTAITNNGTITINAGASISAKSIAGGKIVLADIDETKAEQNLVVTTDSLASAFEYKSDTETISFTAAGEGSTGTKHTEDNKYWFVKDATSITLSVCTTDQSELLVSSAWVGKAEGTIVPVGDKNYIIGFNAFSNIVEAMAGIAATTTTITLEDNTTFNSAATLAPGFEQDLTIAGGNTATINFSGNNDLIIREAAGKTITLAEGTTLKTTGADGYIVLAGEGSYQINGTVDSVSQVAFWGDANVSATGKIVSKYTAPNTGMVLFRSAKEGAEGAAVTITGDEDVEAYQVNTDRTFFVSGVLNTTGTKIHTGTIHFNQNLGLDTLPADMVDGSFVLNSKNTDWTITSIEDNAQASNLGTFNFTGNSTVEVAGAVDLSDKVTLNLEDSEMTAASITNSGAINVGNAAEGDIAASKGTLTAGTLTNTGTITAYSDSSLTLGGGSTNDGTIEVYGTADKKSTIKLTGAFTNDGTYTAGVNVGKFNLTNGEIVGQGWIYNRYQGVMTLINSDLNVETSVLGGELNAENSNFTPKSGDKNLNAQNGSITLVATGTGSSSITANNLRVNNADSAIRINDADDVITTGAAINKTVTEGKYATQVNVNAITNAGTFKAAYADITAETVTNSGTFELANASVTASSVSVTGENAKFNASGELTLNIGELEGTITVNADATFTKTSITGGVISVAAGKKATFESVKSGDLIVNNQVGDITNAGTITVEGTLTAGAITSTTGTITIDAMDKVNASSATASKFVLDQTKLANFGETGYVELVSFNTASSVYLYDANNVRLVNNQIVELGSGDLKQKVQVSISATSVKLYEVGDQTQDIFYVNKTYGAGKQNDGHLFGFNAFSRLADAIKNIALGTTKTISVYSSADAANQVNLTVESGIAIKAADDDVTTTIGFKAGDNGLYLKPGDSITGVNITTTATGDDAWTGSVYVNYEAEQGKAVTIAGNINAAGHIYFCGSADVTGDLKTAGESQILFRAGKSGADAVVTVDGSEISSAWIVMVSGKTEIKNSTVSIGSFGYDNYADTDAAPIFGSTNSNWTIGELDLVHKQTPDTTRAAATINLDNSKFTITGASNTNTDAPEVTEAAEIGKAITIKLAKASTISVAEGTLKNDGIITDDATSTIQANEILNSNKITASSVTGTAGIHNTGTITATTLNVGELANEKENATDAAEINATTIIATSKIDNDGIINAAALTADSVSNSVTGVIQGVYDAETETYGTAEITANQAVTNSGTITAASLTAGGNITNSGTITADSVTATADDTQLSNSGTIEAATLKARRIVNTAGSVTVTDSLEATQNVIAQGGEIKLSGSIKAAALNAQQNGTINITAATVNVVGNIYVYNKMTATGSDLSNQKFSVQEGGDLTVTNSSIDGITLTGTMKLDDTDVANANVAGTFEIISESTFSGINQVGGLTVDEGATLTIDASKSVTGLGPSLYVEGEGSFGNAGAITIDATGLVWGSAWTPIQVVKATGITWSAASITVTTDDPENQAIALIQEDGIYLYKHDSDIDLTTIVVNSAWANQARGTTVTFGGDEYVIGFNAFAAATDVNFTADTEEIKFASGTDSYGDLVLSSSTNITVWNAAGEEEGGTLKLSSFTVNGLGKDNTRINIGEVENQDPDTIVNIVGNVTISNADVDFDEAATTIGGDVTITGESEVEFDRATQITGKLTLEAGSQVEANQGYMFSLGNGSAIDGTLYVNTDEDITTGTTANLGNITGTGKIYTDVNSDLSFGGTFTGNLYIDVTGLEFGNKHFQTTSGSTYKIYIFGENVEADPEGYKLWRKYFTYSTTNGLTQRDDACNVYKVEGETQLNTATAYTWNWTDGQGVAHTAHTDNIVVTGGDFAGTDSATSFKGFAASINDGTFSASRTLGGTTLSTGTAWNYAQTTGTYKLTVNDGTFNSLLVGCDRVTAGSGVHIAGDDMVAINMTINGGLFQKNVAVGVLYDQQVTNGTAAVDGDIYLTITGGTFFREASPMTVYGGNVASKSGFSANTVVYGDITVTIDAQDKDISMQHLIVGSYGKGRVTGDTTLILSGDGSKLSADRFWGGCGSDVYEITETTKTAVSTVDGDRILSFVGFNGELNVGSIKMFDIVKFDEDSNVNFANFGGTLAEIENWEIAYGSENTGAFNNSFIGDTLALTGLTDMAVDEETGIGTWTIFDDVSKFAADDQGNKLAFASVSFDDDLASYELSIQSINEKDAMVLTKSLLA